LIFFMKKHTATSPHSPKAILEELETLVVEAEQMAAESASPTTNGVDSPRERFAAVQDRFGELYADAKNGLAAGARHTGKYVRANPVQSLAIAAGVGLLLGVIVSRRK
jgi:ElaB/YqjD/DUF883 family membrane-anchored ribosome-binding protein